MLAVVASRALIVFSNVCSSLLAGIIVSVEVEWGLMRLIFRLGGNLNPLNGLIGLAMKTGRRSRWRKSSVDEGGHKDKVSSAQSDQKQKNPRTEIRGLV